MGFVNDYNSMALVLRQSKPITFNGSWETVKDALIKAGEIVINNGVVQKVMSITKSASATETAGETLSALCAMDVTESTVAGVTTTTLTPKAAIAFTPKTVALGAIAGAIGLDFGVRLGQNLVNTYFGDEWDWHAPGIYDVTKDAIRTFINTDGTTYYDKETIDAFANRLNEVGAFASGSVEIKPLVRDEKINFYKNIYYNVNDPLLVGVKNVDNAIELCKQGLINAFNLPNDFYTKTPVSLEITVGSRAFIDLFLYYYKENNQIKYLYDKDIYVSNERTSDNDLNNFNNTLISNLGYSSNNCKVYFNIPQVSRLIYACATIISEDNGETWDIARIGENGTWNGSFGYNVNSRIHDYYPLVSESSGGMDGVTKQDGATVPSTFPLDIPQTYPTWKPNAIVRPEDEAAITYPVAMPNTDVIDGTATKPQAQAQTGTNEDAENSKVIADAITIVPEVAKEIEATADPTIDSGDTPTPVIPSIGVQATGFVALYNPTQSQLSAFSQYLWSKDFIDNFSKLFSNPMDAIIGLHLIYATPSRGTQAEIVCGYSHSGVMSNTVNSQYIEINCGSIKVNRYFGNVLDYAPYTKLQAYLPFVGIVDLDTNEIMNGTLNIKYRIDVLTGSCLARLKITRGDYKAELYNFAGNCAVQLPISGGSYSGIIANAIGVAGSIGATIATGGAMAPVLVGSVVSSATNSHTNVSHSGSLGSNAGALGIMKPYLIITRPKPAEANNYQSFYGRPSNKTVRLGSCDGYTRIKDVHVDNIVATDNELTEIEQLLKEGVII